MSAATDALIRKLESIGDVSDNARHAITELPMRVRELGRGEEFVRDGEQPGECCLLIAGVMHRYKIIEEGKRQIWRSISLAIYPTSYPSCSRG